MSTLVEAFDILIVGDEPAGYWWAEWATKITKSQLKGSKKPRPIPRIAYLSLREDRTCVMPLSIAKAFGLNLNETHSVECLFPKEIFLWGDDPLLKKEVQPFKAIPTSKELSNIRYLLTERPDSLDISNGLWRIFGKSASLLPEALLWNSIQLTKYGFWNPPSFKNEPTIRESKVKNLSRNNWIRENSQGHFEAELESGATYSAPRILFAVNAEELMTLREKCKDLESLLTSPKDYISPTSFYEMNLGDLDPRILKPMKPISVFFEERSLPTQEEIHVIKVSHSNNSISLDFSDNTEEETRRSYKALEKLIPDLKPLKNVPSIRKVLKFDSTILASRTHHAKAHLFTPFSQSQYAYPFGQLELAKKHLKAFVGRLKGPLKLDKTVCSDAVL